MKTLRPSGYRKLDLFDLHARAMARQRHGFGVVVQFVRHQQRDQRFRQAGHVLGHVDQRDGEIARRMQHGHAERADQHDLARRRAAGLPQRDRPGEQTDRQNDGGNGVRQAELLQIGQAAPARLHLPLHAVIEARMLALQSAKRPDERHIADGVDHLAVDRGGFVRELMMVRRTGGGELEHPDDENAGDEQQHRGHRTAHGEHETDRERRCKARGQDIPDQHVFDREHRRSRSP